MPKPSYRVRSDDRSKRFQEIPEVYSSVSLVCDITYHVSSSRRPITLQTGYNQKNWEINNWPLYGHDTATIQPRFGHYTASR